jgi:hypothetical protein
MTVVAGVLIGALAGCGGSSGGSASTASPSPSSSTAVAPASTEPNDAATRLAAAARAARHAAYSATYAVRSSAAGAPSRVDVAVTPTATRVVLRLGSKRVIYLTNPRAQYACELPAGAQATCYLLGGSGQRLPGALDPGIGHLFADYPRTLAARTRDYRVTSVPPVAGGIRSSSCFDVSGRSASAARAVTDGTYCWSPAGELTAAVFPSGRLTLTRLGAAPNASELTPPASPTPLPSR